MVSPHTHGVLPHGWLEDAVSSHMHSGQTASSGLVCFSDPRRPWSCMRYNYARSRRHATLGRRVEYNWRRWWWRRQRFRDFMSTRWICRRRRRKRRRQRTAPSGSLKSPFTRESPSHGRVGQSRVTFHTAPSGSSKSPSTHQPHYVVSTPSLFRLVQVTFLPSVILLGLVTFLGLVEVTFHFSAYFSASLCCSPPFPL